MDTQLNTRRTLIGAFGAAALGWLAWRSVPTESQPSRSAGAHGTRFPNPTLYTQDGKPVRFYDDLVRGKVVAINMTYAQCGDTCPATIANLARVHKLLGERAGRDVFLYSITLAPEVDTPRVLKAYAEGLGVKPDWLFLTGKPEDIEALRRALGFYDPDPAVDGNITTHTGMVRIGNDAYDRWTSAAGLARPEQILATINHVDRSVVHT